MSEITDQKRSRIVTWQDPTISAEAAQRLSGLELLQAIVGGELPALLDP